MMRNLFKKTSVMVGLATFLLLTLGVVTFVVAQSITFDKNLDLQGTKSILNANSIGIGTTSPGYKLDVVDSSAVDFQFRVMETGNNYQRTKFDGVQGVAIYFYKNAVAQWQQVVDNNYFGVTSDGANYQFYIARSTGNVGIGTTVPGATLDINSPSGSGIILRGPTSGDAWLNFYGGTMNTANIAGRFATDTGFLVFYTKDAGAGTSEKMRITSTGNVGIGTSTPSYKLDVVGTSQFSQPVIVGTPTANTHATTKSYVDSMFTGSGQWTTNGGLVYLTSTTQNVGIGTTSPGAKLDVADGNIYLETRGGTGGTRRFTIMPFYDIDQSNQMYIEKSSASTDIYSSGLLKFLTRTETNGNIALMPGGTGNVGIGTTGPGAKLEVRVSGAAGVLQDVAYFENSRAYGVGAGNFGPAIAFTAGGGGAALVTGRIGTRTSDETDSSFQSMVFETRNAGTVAERMRITSAGNVGIGEVAPGSKLSVSGGGSFGAGYDTTAAPTGGLIIEGNVGIGTTAPGAKLDVQEASTAKLRVSASNLPGTYYAELYSNYTNGDIAGLRNTSGNIIRSGSAGPAAVSVGVGDAVTILHSGNVGIGTSTPSYKLDVVGTSQFSQPVIVGTPTAASHAATKNYVDTVVISPSAMVVKGNCIGAVTIDWSAGKTQHCVLTGNVTFTFTNGQSGGAYKVLLKQDGVGSRTVTWPAGIRWGSLDIPSLTPVPAKTDYVGFIYNGVDSTYDGVAFNANY